MSNSSMDRTTEKQRPLTDLETQTNVIPKLSCEGRRTKLLPERLTLLPQEIQEVQNEPLGELDKQYLSDDEQSYIEQETLACSEQNTNVEECITTNGSICIETKKNFGPVRNKENKVQFRTAFERKMRGLLGNTDLGVDVLNTPAKEVEQNSQTFAVSEQTPHLYNKARTKQTFITPKTTTQQPKVQCSVDMKPFLRTPHAGPTGFCNKLVSSSTKTIGIVSKRLVSATPHSIHNSEMSCTKKASNVAVPPHTDIIRLNKTCQSTCKDNDDRIKTCKQQIQFPLPFSNGVPNITVRSTTYHVINQIGKGGSSVVYHCIEPLSNSERAIKKVNLANDTVAAGYINEVKMLEKLQNCDRIIKMYDYEIIESEKLLFVVLEKGGPDLAEVLKRLSANSKCLPLHRLLTYWMEMLYAVKHIHENGVIHSDLKPANFLLSIEDGVKLIDFGIASCMQGDMTSVVKSFLIGSFNYISPEAITNDGSNNCTSPSFGKPMYKITYKSDVWSLGCILYQLVYHRTPFQHIGNTMAKLSAILDQKTQIQYPAVKQIPPKIVNTIKKCLQHNARSRPSVEELILEYEDLIYCAFA